MNAMVGVVRGIRILLFKDLEIEKKKENSSEQGTNLVELNLEVYC